LLSIRPSLSQLEFPSKRINVAETSSLVCDRLQVLQQFLRTICSLITINTQHISTEKIHNSLQFFLDLDKRIDRILYLDSFFFLSIPNMAQVYIHNLLQMEAMSKVFVGFEEKFQKNLESLDKNYDETHSQNIKQQKLHHTKKKKKYHPL
jgi:hypothetical protein